MVSSTCSRRMRIFSPSTVPLDSLALDKNIFVGSGLNLGVVDMLHLKTDETLIGMDKNQQGKYIAYLLRN